MIVMFPCLVFFLRILVHLYMLSWVTSSDWSPERNRLFTSVKAAMQSIPRVIFKIWTILLFLPKSSIWFFANDTLLGYSWKHLFNLYDLHIVSLLFCAWQSKYLQSFMNGCWPLRVNCFMLDCGNHAGLHW